MKSEGLKIKPVGQFFCLSHSCINILLSAYFKVGQTKQLEIRWSISENLSSQFTDDLSLRQTCYISTHGFFSSAYKSDVNS